MFIIDDSTSMTSHWTSVQTVFEGLSYLLKHQDPDGIELCFTTDYLVRRAKNTTNLLDILNRKTLNGRTDISNRLYLELEKYKRRLQERLIKSTSKKGKEKDIAPLSIYIFTNGNWINEEERKYSVQELVDNFRDVGLKERQVAIQIITFGECLEQVHEFVHKVNARL
jgi:hypothetical protein